MKLNSTVSNILTNKWVLNIISFLALFNVIGYMVMGKFNNVIFFIILAVLVRNFSKNMIIVLGTPLLIVNLFAMKNGTFEGMENKSDSDTDKTSDKTSDKSIDKKDIAKKAIQNKQSSGSPMLPGTDAPDSESGIISAAAAKKEDFEVGRRKNGASKIDYASTIEDAYDDLNKILGSDGIKRLTDDTQGLMKQQMQLAESMKAMTPLVQGMMPMIEQMKGMMNTMDTKEGLGGVMEIAKKLTNSTNATK
jgi:hypothetical protein